MAGESLETTLRKVKNSGYFFAITMIVYGSLSYQQTQDFKEAQKIWNAATEARAERQQTAIEGVAHLEQQQASLTAQQAAMIAGQERRLQMLENRQK